MKKSISILLTLCLVLTLFAGVMTKNKESRAAMKLPFSIQAPKDVSLAAYQSNPQETTKMLSFSMYDDQLAFMSKTQAEKTEICKDNDYDDLDIAIDVDWAIDDPNAWHYNEFWNWQNPDSDIGNGYDRDGNYRLNAWDVVGDKRDVYGRALNTAVLFSYDKADEGNEKWTGDNYKTPGLKSVLDPTWYFVEPDKTIRIDWTHHTIYVRVRWSYATYIYKGTSRIREVAFSDWSQTVSFGNNAAESGVYSQSTMPIPQISNLQMTGTNNGQYPIASFDLSVPDDVVTNSHEIINKGGSFFMELYAKVYGSAGWKQVTPSNGDIKSQQLLVELNGLERNQKPIAGNAPVELRARYGTEQHDSAGNNLGKIWSQWSSIITVNAGDIAMPSKITKGTNEFSAYRYMTEGVTSDDGVKGASYRKLTARQGKGKDGIALKWKRVKGANRYAIYGNERGNNSVNGAYNQYTKIGEVAATSVKFTEIDGYAIKPGTYYKFVVMAVDAKDKIRAVSRTVYVAAPGGRYTNPKSVRVYKKGSKSPLSGTLRLKKGQSLTLVGSVTKKKGKLTVCRKVRFESSNSKVAKISSSGKLKVRGRGKCVIYAYAQNGICKKLTISA